MRLRPKNAARPLLLAISLAALLVSHGWGEDGQSAREFLQQVYAKYAGNGEGPQTLGKDAPKLFAPELLALIREDQRRSQGEVGLLDHDPICSCQDFEGLEVTAIKVTPGRAARAKAEITFVNSGNAVRVGFELVRKSRHWRILDVIEAEIPSLRAYLANGLKKMKASPK